MATRNFRLLKIVIHEMIGSTHLKWIPMNLKVRSSLKASIFRSPAYYSWSTFVQINTVIYFSSAIKVESGNSHTPNLDLISKIWSIDISSSFEVLQPLPPTCNWCSINCIIDTIHCFCTSFKNSTFKQNLPQSEMDFIHR